jgi:hypothetical protein
VTDILRAFAKFVCNSDGDASIWAKQLVDGPDVELWCGDRLVTRLNASGKPGTVTHEVVVGRMMPVASKIRIRPGESPLNRNV